MIWSQNMGMIIDVAVQMYNLFEFLSNPSFNTTTLIEWLDADTTLFHLPIWGMTITYFESTYLRARWYQ